MYTNGARFFAPSGGLLAASWRPFGGLHGQVKGSGHLPRQGRSTGLCVARMLGSASGGVMRLFVAAVGGLMLASTLAGCSSESADPYADAPFTSAEADAWFDEVYVKEDCPFPDDPETMCTTQTRVRTTEVVLEPGEVVDQSEPILPADMSPPPAELVTIQEQQSVWCFVFRYYDRSTGSLEEGEERVTYAYPCYALGPNPNNLKPYVGELRKDGSIGESVLNTCRRMFPGDRDDLLFFECMTANGMVEEEPTW